MVFLKVSEVVYFDYKCDSGYRLTDYGVISRIEDNDGNLEHWSAWHNYHEDSWAHAENLTLAGPVCLGSWLK